jgi:tight adherence protein B
MTRELLLCVLGAVVVLGATLLVVSRADRRHETRRGRLQAVVATGPRDDGPQLSLRRANPRAMVPNFAALAALWAWVEAALAATGNRIGLPHLAAAGLITAAAVVGFGKVVLGFGPALVLPAAAAAGLAVAAVVLRLAQSRYRRKFLDAFPDALDLICRAVKAGLPVFDSMEVAAHEVQPPVGEELQRTLEEIRIGVDIDEALQHTAERIRVPDFRFFAVSLNLQRRTGGSLAETLSNLSRMIRRRREIRLKANALTSEAKASAAILGLLPFVVGGGLFLISGDLMRVMFFDPRGRFMLGVAVLSVVTGIIVMAVIIKKSLR